MASVPVTLVGVAYTDKTGTPPTPVTIVAELYHTGLGVGGGPIVPPGQPPGIWNPVFPTNPIPIYPGGTPNPPGIWPSPGHPDNSLPPVPPSGAGDKPPPEDSGGWGYVAEWGRWGYFPGTGEAGPKR